MCPLLCDLKTHPSSPAGKPQGCLAKGRPAHLQMNPRLILSSYHILCNPTTPQAKKRGSLQPSLYRSWPASLLISALLHGTNVEMEAWKMGEGGEGEL